MHPAIAIDEQAIRQRAHERWLSRGSPAGTPEQDWLEAERELADESGRAATRTVVASPAGTSVEPAAPASIRRRAPRSIVTRAAGAPAARLLVALSQPSLASRRG